MPGVRGFVLRGIVCVALVLFPAAGGRAEEAESIAVKATLPTDRGPMLGSPVVSNNELVALLVPCVCTVNGATSIEATQ